MKRIWFSIFIFMTLAVFTQAFAQVRDHLLVETEWLAANLDNPDVVVIHVASKSDRYEQGHIPGAHFLSWSDVAETRDGLPNEFPEAERLIEKFRQLGIDANDRIVIYDESSGIQAARAYIAFDYVGLGDRAALLNGHLKKWENENRPLTTEKPQVEPSDLQLQEERDVVIKFDEVRELSKKAKQGDENVAIIDARPEADYKGTRLGSGLQRAGHIPGAANIFWMQHIESEDNPVMKSPEELQKLYANAGIAPKDQVITYCRTGGQASHSYFTLKYLGYDPLLYDGSFTEWSAAPDTEVIQESE